MPANFFTIAWQLVFTIIVLAGIIVILAAVTTMVAAITRARQVANGLKSQAQQGMDDVDDGDQPSSKASHHTSNWDNRKPGVVEMVTTDGIHYIPVP